MLRPVCRALIFLLLAVSSSLAGAQGFPAKLVRIVVPFPPGAATDTVTRLVAQRLSEVWGQPVLVDNKPGAGSILGAETVARAPADGYTIFLGHIGTHGANPALYEKLPYDPVRDFAPVTLLVTIPNFVAVHPAVPAANIGELVALSRARPGALNVATPGIATSAHLILALFGSSTGAQLTHVPYKGSVAAMQALVAGDVQVALDTTTTLTPQARAGKARLLAVTSRERSHVAIDVPTLAEAGVPGFDVSTWFAFFVPAGTPQAAIDRLQSDTVRALRAPDVAERLQALGMNIVGGSSAALADHVNAEIARWGKVVREAKIRVE